MKFASFPVTEAHNMIMGHSTRAGDVWLKKGQRLDEAAIQILQNADIDQVYAAQLDSSDVAEDIAAETLAKALAGAMTLAAILVLSVATNNAAWAKTTTTGLLKWASKLAGSQGASA